VFFVVWLYLSSQDKKTTDAQFPSGKEISFSTLFFLRKHLFPFECFDHKTNHLIIMSSWSSQKVKTDELKPQQRQKEKKKVLAELDEDSLGRSTEVALINEHAAAVKKCPSFLSAEALRWMNKRRPCASNSSGSSSKQHVAPSRILQLRSIFKGLDFDGSGEISLEELKQAISYVGDRNEGGEPLFEDPDKINSFFESMDTDGNGSVDFDEFLVGMTSQDDGSNNMARMQQAFFDFANQHRRQMIIDKVADKNIPDLERFEEMIKLFNIQFFKEEKECTSVEDQIRAAKAEAISERKQLQAESGKIRQIECARARGAAIYFKGQNDCNNSTSSFAVAMTQNVNHDEKKSVLSRANSQVALKLQNFSLKDRCGTYTPLLKCKSANEIRSTAVLDSNKIKSGPSKSSTKVLAPPVNVKQTILKQITTDHK